MDETPPNGSSVSTWSGKPPITEGEPSALLSRAVVEQVIWTAARLRVASRLLVFGVVVLILFSGQGASGSTTSRNRVGQRVALVSLSDWSLVAWRSGAGVCYSWRGEPGSIEAASGCRPPLTGTLMLLIAETGSPTRLAGLAAPSVATVSVTTGGRTVSVRPKLIAALGQQVRFFFLQVSVPNAQIPSRWTLLALDTNGRPLGRLRI